MIDYLDSGHSAGSNPFLAAGFFFEIPIYKIQITNEFASWGGVEGVGSNSPCNTNVCFGLAEQPRRFYPGLQTVLRKL